jgi:superfamily II DNA or RNA helicase
MTGVKRPAAVLPTAAGKTVIFSALISMVVREEKRRPLILVHREELVFQTVAKLKAIDPYLSVGVIKADKHEINADVVVASIQSICRRLGTGPRAIPADRFDLVIVDECHHAAARTWLNTLEYFGAMDDDSDTVCLGVTATLARSDSIPLGHIWQEVCFEYSAHDAITDGYLVRPIAQRVVLDGLDLKSVKVKAGDFSESDLGKRMYRSGQQIANAVLQHGMDASGRVRRGITFAPTVDCANQWAADFNALGIRSEVVIGETPTAQRQESYRKLTDRRIDMLIGCMVMCLDDETEILTSSGWVGVDDMTLDHLVANWEDGKITFEKPSEVVRRPLGPDERMYSLLTRGRDVRVTGKHRMVFAERRGGAWTKAPVEDIVGRAVTLPTTGLAEPLDVAPTQETYPDRARAITASSYNLRKLGYGRDESRTEAARRLDRRRGLRYKNPSELTLDDCRFIGFWLGDGSTGEKSKGGQELVLSQSVAYPRIVAWVDGLLHRLGMDFNRFDRSDYPVPHIRWSMARGTGFGSQERNGFYALEPYLEKDGCALLWGLSREQFDALLEGLWYADGNHKKAEDGYPRGWQIYATRKGLLDTLQAIGASRGMEMSVRPSTPPRDESHQQLWILTRSQIDMHTTATKRFQETLAVPGETVWCVKTRTKNIVTRRNGTVTVTGNTEGFDLPAAEMVVMGRPTKSMPLYIQMIGRGLRLSPETGKVDCLILDVCGTIQDKITTLIDLDIPDVCECGCETCEFEHLCVLRCTCPRTQSGKLKRPCIVCKKNGADVRACPHYERRHVITCQHHCDGIGMAGEWEEDPTDEIILDAAGNPIEWDVDHSEVRLKQVDLFDASGQRIIRPRRRRSAWSMTNSGIPYLPKTSTFNEWIFLWPDGDTWTVGRKNGGRATKVSTHDTFAEAVQEAEALHPRKGKPGSPLVGPATDKQLDTLRRFGCQVHDGMTKQQASEMLDRVFASKALDPA